MNFASQQLQSEYKDFWPGRGEQQNWDAIGYANRSETRELILVEAKGHPAEISFTGTTAQENGGRPQIRQAFRETLKACGINEGLVDNHAEQWLSGCYQYANRLATLYFFHKRNIPARLVFLYFCGDKHPSGRFCPQSITEWDETLKQVKSQLGLDGTSELEAKVHNVFVNVNDIFAGNAQ